MKRSCLSVPVCTVLLAFLFTSASALAQTGAIIAATAPSGPCSSPPASPHFSVRSGAYSAPLSVRLTDHARGAVIFYTTDGWTPTSNSARYLGPIPVDTTTTVQAVAVVPNCSSSGVSSATYALPSAPPALPSAALLPALPTGQDTFTLRADAQIPLVFASAIDSSTAQVGDPIAFTLAQDLKIGDTVFAPKGSSATGRVIQVDHSGIAGQPGEIQFQVDSLTVEGSRISLHAIDALSARSTAGQPKTVLAAVSTAGISLLFNHGMDAQIPAGTPLTATMAAGTVLTSPNGQMARLHAGIS